MILEEKVTKILKKGMPDIEKQVKWDGMYDRIANKIVKEIKEEIVR